MAKTFTEFITDQAEGTPEAKELAGEFMKIVGDVNYNVTGTDLKAFLLAHDYTITPDEIDNVALIRTATKNLYDFKVKDY